MERVDQVKRPLELGEWFLVPCYYNVITHFDVMYDDQLEWMDVDLNEVIGNVGWEKVIKIPVINHPHHDKENGQHYTHSHVDFRFVKPGTWPEDENGNGVVRVNT